MSTSCVTNTLLLLTVMAGIPSSLVTPPATYRTPMWTVPGARPTTRVPLTRSAAELGPLLRLGDACWLNVTEASGRGTTNPSRSTMLLPSCSCW